MELNQDYLSRRSPRRGKPSHQKLWFQSLLTCAGVITLVLLVTMFYAGSKYMDSQDITTFSKAKDFIFNGKNFSNITTQFMPTFKYYDWNVNHKLVHLQQWGGAACDATQNFEEVTSIFKWPGTKKGCLQDSKVVLGKCSNSVGTTVDETQEASLRKWRKGLFCVNYVGETNKLPNIQVTEAATCDTGYIKCDTCTCVKGTKCPISGFKIMDSTTQAAEITAFGGTTDSKNALPTNTNIKAFYKYANTKNQPFMITPQVELYGVPCINPSNDPVAPVGHYAILNVIGKDCTFFGNDLVYAQIADTYKEWLFYKDNEEYMTSTRMTLPMYQNTVEQGAGMANLFGRYQIQRTCDTFCQTFRFSTKAQELATEYFLLWDRIKLIFFASLLYSITILVVAFWVNSRMRVVKKTVLGEYCLTITFVVLFVIALINKSFITSTNFTFGNYWEILWGILAVVAFISVVVVNWLKRTQAKIMYFIVLYILLIVFLVSLLVLVWMTLYRIQNNYTSRRKYFTEAETKMCIKNVEWAKILIKFNKYMDLTFISESLWWFQMFYVIFTLLTIAFFGYCLAKIKKAKTFKYIQLQNTSRSEL